MGVAPNFVWSKRLAQFDYQILVYMDDLLFLSYEDDSTTTTLIELLRHLFDMFGLTINEKKSALVPASSVEFLGYVVSVNGTLTLCSRRLVKVRRFAKQLIQYAARNKRFISFSKLRSFAGMAVSTYASCLYARLFVRGIYNVLATY
jgi:hypothetical protein